MEAIEPRVLRPGCPRYGGGMTQHGGEQERRDWLATPFQDRADAAAHTAPPPLPGPQTPGTGLPEVVPQAPLPVWSAQPAPRPARVQGDQIVQVFGDTQRTGMWTAAQRTTVLSGFGDTRLDLREVIKPGETLEIECWTLFGDVRVVVPPGTEVLVNGGTLFGDVKTERDPRDAVAPTGARLVLKGYSLFGDVRVREAGPDLGKPPRGWRWTARR